MTPLKIGNNGPVIVSTNYWETEYASRALYFLSFNAGSARLLMPPAQEDTNALLEMATARSVIVTRGRYEGKADAIEILFDDETDSPYALFMDPAQTDRRWRPGDEGKLIPFVIYGAGLHVLLTLTCRLRRAPTLPHMQPWSGQ